MYSIFKSINLASTFSKAMVNHAWHGEHAVVFLQEINSQSAVKKSDKVNGKPGFAVTNILPYPCSGKYLISNLVKDYIQKRSGEPVTKISHKRKYVPT